MNTVLTAEDTEARPALGLEASARPVESSAALPRGEAAAVRAAVAGDLDKWRRRNRYYHGKITEYLRFIVPQGEPVLLIGCEDGKLLDALAPSRGVGVDESPQMIKLARARYGRHSYFQSRYEQLAVDGPFEYIILNGMVSMVDDLSAFLKSIHPLCTPTTRVLVVQHNYLWWPLIRIGARLRLVRPHCQPSWLSAHNVQVCANAAGLENLAVHRKLVVPRRMFGLGSLINAAFGLLPFVDRLASTEILIARPKPKEPAWMDKTCTVVLTVRDERGNIEPMVRAIPKVGSRTEIIFVEGHSTDGTREEIERVIRAYPERDIKLLIQDGIGQGDATRKGFAAATGDVIIILEADQTSPPKDVAKVFELIAAGHAEYVNGTRFIYPKEKRSMPVLNVIGNILFALWFTWFLGQRTSDVLCGIKGIDRRQYQRLHRSWGFLGVFDPFGDFELLFGAHRLVLRICEIPTKYAPRVYGVPKTSFFRHGWQLVRIAGRAVSRFKCA